MFLFGILILLLEHNPNIYYIYISRGDKIEHPLLLINIYVLPAEFYYVDNLLRNSGVGVYYNIIYYSRTMHVPLRTRKIAKQAAVEIKTGITL
jgi:hypothetical protein